MRDTHHCQSMRTRHKITALQRSPTLHSSSLPGERCKLHLALQTSYSIPSHSCHTTSRVGSPAFVHKSCMSGKLLLLFSLNFPPILILPHCLWAFGFTCLSHPASHAQIISFFRSVIYISSFRGNLFLVLQTAIIFASPLL